MAWGLGLHQNPRDGAPVKIEGDGKSPAGLFSIGTAFGFTSKSEMESLKIDYLVLDNLTEAVDDTASRYYNTIVHGEEILIPDSSEKMGSIPVYALGLVINHNIPHPLPGAGSAIFWHIWVNENKGTDGCTAMSKENIALVLSWLDRNKNPLVLQLPLLIYQKFSHPPLGTLPKLSD